METVMSGESQKEPGSHADPTVLTTEQLERAVANLRTQIEAQLTIRDERVAGVVARLEVRDSHLDERYRTQTEAVDKAFSSAEKAVDLRQDQANREFHEHLEQVRHENKLALENADKATTAAFLASDKAITKAETANEKRFESVNEFRSTLSDQQKNFLPRQEYDTAHVNLVERVNELQDRINRSEGKGLGISTVWGVGVAVVTVLIAVIVAANAIFGT